MISKANRKQPYRAIGRAAIFTTLCKIPFATLFGIVRSQVKVLLLLGFALCSTALANEKSVNEYSIKAAYLYHFTQFAQWPVTALPPSDESFHLCILGANPFGDELTPVTQRHYNGHPIRIIQLNLVLHNNESKELQRIIQNCQLLYITDTHANHIATVLEQSHSQPILTVSSEPGFAARGGIIGFVVIKNKVRLEINRSAALRANIKLSSKLLEVASVVENNKPGEEQP